MDLPALSRYRPGRDLSADRGRDGEPGGVVAIELPDQAHVVTAADRVIASPSMSALGPGCSLTRGWRTAWVILGNQRRQRERPLSV